MKFQIRFTKGILIKVKFLMEETAEHVKYVRQKSQVWS